MPFLLNCYEIRGARCSYAPVMPPNAAGVVFWRARRMRCGKTGVLVLLGCPSLVRVRTAPYHRRHRRLPMHRMEPGHLALKSESRRKKRRRRQSARPARSARSGLPPPRHVLANAEVGAALDFYDLTDGDVISLRVVVQRLRWSQARTAPWSRSSAPAWGRVRKRAGTARNRLARNGETGQNV